MLIVPSFRLKTRKISGDVILGEQVLMALFCSVKGLLENLLSDVSPAEKIPQYLRGRE